MSILYITLKKWAYEEYYAKQNQFLSIALAGQVKIKIVLSWHVFLLVRSFFNDYIAMLLQISFINLFNRLYFTNWLDFLSKLCTKIKFYHSLRHKTNVLFPKLVFVLCLVAYHLHAIIYFIFTYYNKCICTLLLYNFIFMHSFCKTQNKCQLWKFSVW